MHHSAMLKSGYITVNIKFYSITNIKEIEAICQFLSTETDYFVNISNDTITIIWDETIIDGCRAKLQEPILKNIKFNEILLYLWKNGKKIGTCTLYAELSETRKVRYNNIQLYNSTPFDVSSLDTETEFHLLYDQIRNDESYFLADRFIFHTPDTKSKSEQDSLFYSHIYSGYTKYRAGTSSKDGLIFVLKFVKHVSIMEYIFGKSSKKSEKSINSESVQLLPNKKDN